MAPLLHRLRHSLHELPHHARLLLLSLALGSLPIGLLLVFFPLYLHDLGLPSTLIGGVFSLAGFGSSLLLIAIGPLADRFGRRRFLIAGTALPLFGFLVFSLTTSTPWLVVASMVGGVGYSGGLGGGLVTATFNPLLADTVAPRQRTTVLSWAEGVWTAVMAAGTLLAGLPSVLAHVHLAPLLTLDRAAFILCAMTTIAATLVLLPIRDVVHTHETPGPVVEEPEDVTNPRGTIATIVKLAVFFALQGAGLGLVVQLLPLWFVLRFHSSAATVAPWFAAASIVGLLTIPLVPLLVRRLGAATVIALVAGSSTVLLIGVPLAGYLPVAGAFFMLRSALIAMQWPAQSSFLQGAVPRRWRGTATSVTMGCWSITNAALPSVAGFMMDRHQLDLPIVLGIACYVAATGWFWLTLRHTPLPEERAHAALHTT